MAGSNIPKSCPDEDRATTLASLLAIGYSVARAAAIVDLAPNTARGWTKADWWAPIYGKATLSPYHNLLVMLANKAMFDILQTGSDALRLKAAMNVLDRYDKTVARAGGAAEVAAAATLSELDTEELLRSINDDRSQRGEPTTFDFGDDIALHSQGASVDAKRHQ